MPEPWPFQLHLPLNSRSPHSHVYAALPPFVALSTAYIIYNCKLYECQRIYIQYIYTYMANSWFSLRRIESEEWRGVGAQTCTYIRIYTSVNTPGTMAMQLRNLRMLRCTFLLLRSNTNTLTNTHTHTHTHVLRERVTTHTHVRLLHKLMYNGLPECICMHLCTLNVHLRQQPHINSNTHTHTHAPSRTCICKANLYLCCS